jgi:phosphoribosyl-ATP pyrophosphohydrolase/phosphoribosyl-AMP cyclohydrolase
VTTIDHLWNQTQPNEQGLVPCVVQDLRTRAVLMMAWVSREALEKTLETGYAWYWSRSRGELWQKGATSGHTQRIVTVRLDCDGDTLLYLVEAKLPSCHHGTDTCFSKRRAGGAWKDDPVELSTIQETGVLADLETIIAARAESAAASPPSYTKSLLDAGTPKQVAKIHEESEELCAALTNETDERVLSEAADLLYHLAVALKHRKLSFRGVLGELERRFSRSGIEEKASRGSKY